MFVVLEQVSFSYGTQSIFHDFNLELTEGVSYALIGKSGVGKSTLLNLLAGFIKPSKGTVMVNQHEVTAPRKRTSYLFQELGLFPWQTVAQAIAMPLRLEAKSTNADIEAAVFALMEELGLMNLKDKYPKELSGGEKQRVALARTLIGNPDLILMDEPTSALDSMTKENIQHMIRTFQKKRRATLLFITHDIEEAVLLGEKIILLNRDMTSTILDNPLYGVENAKEQLKFYELCIGIRKLIKTEKENHEVEE